MTTAPNKQYRTQRGARRTSLTKPILAGITALVVGLEWPRDKQDSLVPVATVLERLGVTKSVSAIERAVKAAVIPTPTPPSKYVSVKFQSYSGKLEFVLTREGGERLQSLLSEISTRKLYGAELPSDRKLQLLNWMTQRSQLLDEASRGLVRNNYIRDEVIAEYSSALGCNLENFDLRSNACLRSY